MAFLDETLVVGISTRALFDLEEENRIFQERGVSEYRKFQRENEQNILGKGTAFHLVEALLNLNHLVSKDRLVEVIVMSRNSPEAGIRVLNSIQHYNLDITRSAFTGGEPLATYMDAFSVDLFLSRDEKDVQDVIDSGKVSAALILDRPENFKPDEKSVRIAFDADAVLFSEASEYIYKTEGLAAFQKNESVNVNVPLDDGPHSRFLRVLARIQKKILESVSQSPLKIAIVTARNSPAHMRILNTLRNWDVYIDEAFFLGGVSKDKILQAFKAHIFFDDQETHLKLAATLVPSGRVPYKSDSKLNDIDKNSIRLDDRIAALRKLQQRKTD